MDRVLLTDFRFRLLFLVVCALLRVAQEKR
jgi:hypothetical protein